MVACDLPALGRAMECSGLAACGVARPGELESPNFLIGSRAIYPIGLRAHCAHCCVQYRKRRPPEPSVKDFIRDSGPPLEWRSGFRGFPPICLLDVGR